MKKKLLMTTAMAASAIAVSAQAHSPELKVTDAT